MHFVCFAPINIRSLAYAGPINLGSGFITIIIWAPARFIIWAAARSQSGLRPDHNLGPGPITIWAPARSIWVPVRFIIIMIELKLNF